MLRSLKDLERYAVSATDGDIGNVENFLFDDERWIVRYLIVQTNGIFKGHSVLVSPVSFRDIEWSALRFHLALTKDKVQESPEFDRNKPFSRMHEGDFFQYYGYSPYWGYAGHWGTGAYPSGLATNNRNAAMEGPPEKSDDVHLRSAKEVRGYHIEGNDEAIGHIEDFIVDDQTWEVRYLVINTSNWCLGKSVLVSPHWANRISWEDKKVFVALSRHAIQNSPEWEAFAPINREYETRLYDYYGRPQYWDNSDRPIGSPPPRRPDNQPR